jgi:hypothetical protein
MVSDDDDDNSTRELAPSYKYLTKLTCCVPPIPSTSSTVHLYNQSSSSITKSKTRLLVIGRQADHRWNQRWRG